MASMMSELAGYQTWTGHQGKRDDGSVYNQIQVFGATVPFTQAQALEQAWADFPHATRIVFSGPVPRGDVLHDAPESEGWRRLAFVIDLPRPAPKEEPLPSQELTEEETCCSRRCWAYRDTCQKTGGKKGQEPPFYSHGCFNPVAQPNPASKAGFDAAEGLFNALEALDLPTGCGFETRVAIKRLLRHLCPYSYATDGQNPTDGDLAIWLFEGTALGSVLCSRLPGNV